MERWRELAETVPGTLLYVAVGTGVLLRMVCSAHRMLTTAGGISDATAGLFGGAPPSLVLEGALRELARLDALHAGGGHAFNLYVTRCALPLASDQERQALEPVYKSWQNSLLDAVFHATDARRKLRAAAVEAHAAEGAWRVLRSFPRGSPDWTAAWTSEAAQLASRAADTTASAFVALWRMRDEVVLEFLDACSMRPIKR